MISTTTNPDFVVLSESTDGVGARVIRSESSTSFFDLNSGHFQHQNLCLFRAVTELLNSVTPVNSKVSLALNPTLGVPSGSTFRCRFEDLTPSNRHLFFLPFQRVSDPNPSLRSGYIQTAIDYFDSFDQFRLVGLNRIIPIRRGEKRVPKLKLKQDVSSLPPFS